VAQAIVRLLSGDAGKGSAYNIGQDETLALPEFLELLARTMGSTLRMVRLPREELNHHGLLPDCSPFSGKWMSSLENQRSKQNLGMAYTPIHAYLSRLVSYFQAAPPRAIQGYLQRQRELNLVESINRQRNQESTSGIKEIEV